MNQEEAEKKIATMDITPFRPGMRSVHSLCKEFRIGHSKVEDCFRQCFENKEKIKIGERN